MSSPDELNSTPRYDRIVAASRQVAWDLGHTYVGVEHLFLAIVQDPDAAPTQVLSRFVPPGQVGAAVRDLITSDGWWNPDPLHAMPFALPHVVLGRLEPPWGWWRL